MSGSVMSRGAANGEQMSGGGDGILCECYRIYTEAGNGLISLGQSVGVDLLPPQKKITVMLLGNRSAGKSSFINWYVEEHIQPTGVTTETQGFTFVTSGRKRESLTESKGVSEYLSTEVCASQQKRFSLVTFVDTPGLVAGDLKYPFDVEEVILWLSKLCDLILVFFDPMEQALCERILNVIEELNKCQGDRLRFYLSKADEAGIESDRQRVVMQIQQELCKRLELKECGFEMPTIYIPNPNKPSHCLNEIEEVCRTIEKTIIQTVKNTLNSLEKD